MHSKSLSVASDFGVKTDCGCRGTGKATRSCKTDYHNRLSGCSMGSHYLVALEGEAKHFS